MENKWNIPQVGKVTLFKPRVGKVISGQTTSEFSVITFFFSFLFFCDAMILTDLGWYGWWADLGWSTMEETLDKTRKKWRWNVTQTKENVGRNGGVWKNQWEPERSTKKEKKNKRNGGV